MGVGPEVEPGEVGRRGVEDGHLEGRGQGPERGHHEQGLEAPLVGAGQEQHGQDHQGPDQVELLLHGQGPGVGERGGGPGGHEVVAGRVDLPPVGVVEEGGQGILSEPGVEPGRLGEPDHEGHGHQHDEEGRQQSPGPAQPEGRELDPAPPGELGEQEAGDQVAGQDIEDVQAEEAPLEPPHPEVVAHDDEQGHRPQPVQGVDPDLAGGRRPGGQRVGVFGFGHRVGVTVPSDTRAASPSRSTSGRIRGCNHSPPALLIWMPSLQRTVTPSTSD